MKSFVAAVIFICTHGGVCEQKHVEIDPKACNFGTVDAKLVEMNTDVKIGIHCKK
jgi:hypothetical protein